MPTKFPWSSLDRELQVIEHSPIDLSEALDISRKYYSVAGQKFEYGEDALAATLFSIERPGAANSPGPYMTFTINGFDHISFEVNFCDGKRSYETVLKSAMEMENKIRDFYNLSLDDIRSNLPKKPWWQFW